MIPPPSIVPVPQRILEENRKVKALLNGKHFSGNPFYSLGDCYIITMSSLKEKDGGAMKNPFKSFDDRVIHFMNQTIRCKFFDFFFYHVTNLAGPTALVLFCTVPMPFLKSTGRLVLLEVIGALILSGIVVQILKRIFMRNRPYWILKELNTLGLDLSDYSFPSGHTTAGFSLGTVLALNFPEYGVFFILFACIIGLSRMYLAVHYPTDVMAGMVIGVVSALVMHYLLFPMVLDAAMAKRVQEVFLW